MSGSYQDPYAPGFDPNGANFPATYPNLLARGNDRCFRLYAFRVVGGRVGHHHQPGNGGGEPVAVPSIGL